jgi:hypothetical protein
MLLHLTFSMVPSPKVFVHRQRQQPHWCRSSSGQYHPLWWPQVYRRSLWPPKSLPQGWDSGALFIGMVYSGSPSRCTHLKESSGEDSTTSGARGSMGPPGPRGCNVVTLMDPIIAALVPESTPTLQTIPTVTVQTAEPQPGMEHLPDQQQAYQEEQQA